MDLVTLTLIVVNLILWPALGVLAIRAEKAAPREQHRERVRRQEQESWNESQMI